MTVVRVSCSCATGYDVISKCSAGELEILANDRKIFSGEII